MAAALNAYVGTYTESIRFGTGELFQGKGEGIYLFEVEPEQGGLTLRSVAVDVKNPSYLCLGPGLRSLYAVNELKEHEDGEGGTVSSFTVDPSTGALTCSAVRATGGTDPCHIVAEPRGQHVMVANYSSGSVSLYPVLRDGSLDSASDFVQHAGSSVNRDRQAGPHAHQSVFDAHGRFVFVPDLGLDRIVAYRYLADRGKLERIESAGASMSPGSGPRHMAFSPDGHFAYVVNELDSSVTACEYSAESGKLAVLDTVSTLPEDFRGESSGAAIAIHPSGRFVYASNRGHDSIAVFRCDPETGRLHPTGHASTGGSSPRDFTLDPSGRLMLVTNQGSDSVVSFRIDSESGMPKPTGKAASVGTPVCVKVVEVG